jgi:hypothetical protein
MGAVFGGGKDVSIGALAGAGGGALTQLFTRGKEISVPAETAMTFRLERTLGDAPIVRVGDEVSALQRHRRP